MIPIGVTNPNENNANVNLEDFTTNDLEEGQDHLYFTSERALAAAPENKNTIAQILKESDETKTVSDDTVLFTIDGEPTIFKFFALTIFQYIKSKLYNIFRSFSRSTFGDTDYTVTPSDNYVTTTETFTSQRRVYLDSTRVANRDVVIADDAQAINGNNVLTIRVENGKSLNGIVNGTEVISTAGGQRRLFPDGNGNWFCNTDTLKALQNKTVATSTYTLLDSDSNCFLIFTAACVVTVPSGLKNVQFQGIQAGYNSSVSFVADTGVTLYRAATENAITAEQFSVFGIRYLYGTSPYTYSLFGRLQQI